ncbi:MAG: hypothetical protein KatS3mg057_0592 [Herpetosiphonaceae bacterium]|nr:MAG: hypothetical protein KatS3mg057_0592 [Herpetosiphonaceae bacterium]
MAVDTLLSYLFDGKRHPLAAPLERWLVASPRFAAFAATYRDKIRKKIRGLRDAESRRDLQLELEIAYLLLQDRQFTVAYEPYASEKIRGPDFAVTFKTQAIFNLEVTRMRGARPIVAGSIQGASHPGQDQLQPVAVQQPINRRLSDIICSKLGQLQPGMMNILLVAIDRRAVEEIDVGKTVQHLKERAEAGDLALFHRHGLRSRSEFFKAYQRLSSLLVRSSDDGGISAFESLWINSQAKHPLPNDIRTRLQR